MTGKTKAVFFLLLLLMVSGCAGRPIFTVEVYQTPTPVQQDTGAPTATPLSLPTISFAPTMTPFSAAWPPDYSPILYGKKYDANTFFILLGGVQGEKWIGPDQAAAQIGGEWEYDVYTFEHSNFQVHGFAPEFSPPSQLYFIGTGAMADDAGMVGVADGWPVLQREVQELTPDQEIYRQVVLDWLLAQGVSSPALGVLHIYRVDLEGDGVDEIFISATHLDDSWHYTQSGDHSLVLMRKVLGNQAVTLPLVADVYHSAEAEITYPRMYSLANFIDLDRDGILEVIVGFEKWEGTGALVYQVEGQSIVQVP